MRMNRREAIKAGTLGVAAAAGMCNLAEAAALTIAVRKDIATLDEKSPEIVALKKAVKRMKELPEDDCQSWTALAAIHGTLAEGFRNCQHSNWFFLPWHRAYLLVFERIVRELSEDQTFALPYWNWAQSKTTSPLFWGMGNPLDNPARAGEDESGRGITKSSKIDAARHETYLQERVINDILDTPDFASFGGTEPESGKRGKPGRLESTPHNTIHSWVEGDMASGGGAAYDPMFWLHHCNLDRLWMEWVRKHPDGLPADKKWRDTEFDFCDGSGKAFEISVEETLDIEALGYRYDTRPQVTKPAGSSKVVLLASLAGKEHAIVGGVVGEFRTEPADEKSVAGFNELVNKVAVKRARESVRLSVVFGSIPKQKDVGLDLFVNCEKLTPETPLSDPSYIGSCTWFHGSHHGEKEGSAFLFDVTPRFVKFYAETPLKPEARIQVGMITRSLKNGSLVSVEQLQPQSIRFEAVDHVPA